MPGERSLEELMTLVAERAAQLDPDLDRQLESAFLRAARARMAPPAIERLRAAVESLDPARSFAPTSIPTSSRLPGGSSVHQAIAKVVGRQVDGLTQQGREYGDAVRVALHAVLATFDEILEATRIDLVAEIDALYERVFVLEHQLRDVQLAQRQDEAGDAT